jgi:hypothetical protein
MADVRLIFRVNFWLNFVLFQKEKMNKWSVPVAGSTPGKRSPSALTDARRGRLPSTRLVLKFLLRLGKELG